MFGRDQEADLIDRLLSGAHQHGGALVVRGEAGIGKSALLDEAIRVAADQGMLVLRAVGVQSEANLPFAGLHQLLRPIFARHHDLPALENSAMKAAFGTTRMPPPELYLIALATLELLSEVATRTPVLLAAEDAHWLDRPTADVLAFVGRRLESDPVILIAAIREGYDSPLLAAGLPELRAERLPDQAARELLNARFPDLAPAVLDRLLDEAEGNPLALLELPAALGATTRGGEAPLPPRLPLTVRLERAFAARAAELPGTTRTLLRIAAADSGCDLAVIMRAAELTDGMHPAVKDLVPAMRAHLIEVDGTTARFRHPLVRSAIYQAASLAERHAAHAALAEVLADDPDRRVWHRAAAAVGRDPAVAAELEETARRARSRGGLITAAAAFERAADFASDPSQQGALLLRAAEAASELGRSDMMLGLLHRTDSLELGPRERARSMWLGDAFREGPAGDPAHGHALVQTARRMSAEGDTDLALNLLLAAAFRCHWADLYEDAGPGVLLAADEIAAVQEDPRLLQIQAYVAPIRRGAAVISQLSAAAPPTDPAALYRLGSGACLAGAFGQASSLLGSSAVRLREQGRLRLLTQVLETRAWAALMTADFAVAMPAAEESARLAAETAQPTWQAAALIAQAVLAALRGEEAPVEKLTAEAERFALPAAEGLSNREIGQRLYLSRRTIESHLYRVFPKLGITSRGQLPRVLGSGSPRPPDSQGQR